MKVNEPIYTWWGGNPCFGASMYQKGVAFSWSDPEAEWVCWVATSLNSCLARWSYFPTLLNKCVWFTLTVFDVRVNLRILMWGIGTKGYPEVWWKPTLRIFFVIF